jgi:hypothetical protein
MGKTLQSLFGIVFVVVTGAFGLMSIIVKPFHVVKVAVYKANYDGNTQYLFLLPNNKVVYRKEAGKYFDTGLFGAYGEEADHIGPFYQVLSSSWLSVFGIRYYPDVEKVVRLDVKLLKTEGNIHETTFGEIGKVNHQRWIFYSDRIELADSEYKRLEGPEAKQKAAAITEQLQIDTLTAVKFRM